jgi:uncharacterized protein (TIGR02996 family)
MDIVSRRRPADVGRLLDVLTRSTWTLRASRLEQLGWFGDDPRIARALVEIALRRARQHLPAELWSQIFALVLRGGDARLVDALTQLAGNRTDLSEQIVPLIGVLTQRAPNKLSADERSALRALTDATDLLQPSSEDTLFPPPPPDDSDRAGEAALAAIYANPDDDEARLVYADWLLDRNDPRGEFITLQMKVDPSPADRTRCRRLLELWEQTWLGPIAQLVSSGANRWDRGFLMATRAPERVGSASSEAIDHPSWNTVRTLDVHQPDTRFLVGCELRFVESILGTLTFPQLAVMWARPRPYPRLRVLHVAAEGRLDRNAFQQVSALPALRDLHITGPTREWQWLVATRLFRQLVQFTFEGDIDLGLVEKLQALPNLVKFTNGVTVWRRRAGAWVADDA